MIRLLVAAGAVLAVAAGCGGGGAPSRLERVDRPVSAPLARAFGPASGSQAACMDVVTGAMSDCHSAQSSLSRTARPRLLAALPLSWPELPGYEALFVLFRTGQGSACFDVQVARRDGSGAGPLKCLGNARCGPVCVTAIAKQGRTVLGGTVSRDASELRLIYPGETLSYGLDGPTAFALAGRRIFIADVGTRGEPLREELMR